MKRTQQAKHVYCKLYNCTVTTCYF